MTAVLKGGVLDGRVQSVGPLFPWDETSIPGCISFGIGERGQEETIYYANDEGEKDDLGRLVYRPATIVVKK